MAFMHLYTLIINQGPLEIAYYRYQKYITDNECIACLLNCHDILDFFVWADLFSDIHMILMSSD